MRYINKNQIVAAAINSIHTRKDKKITWELCLTMTSIVCNDMAISYKIQSEYNKKRISKDTKEECIALAEKLGLTLID